MVTASGAVLHQQRCHGAAALVQPGLDDSAVGGTVGVGLQLAHLGGEGQHLQQVVHAHAGLGGDGADNGVAAPLLGDEVVFGQLLHDAVGRGAGLIHLVYGNDYVNAGGLRVVYGLNGLRHDSVIRSDDEHRDIRSLRAARSHRGERRVAGGVKEGYLLTVEVNSVCADMLSNAARLGGCLLYTSDAADEL